MTAVVFGATLYYFPVLSGGMKVKIGVMGSSSSREPAGSVRRARDLGRCVAQRGLALVTGAGPGLPLEAARAARKAGGVTLGISPAASLDEHRGRYGLPSEAFDLLVFTGAGYSGRNAVNVYTSDVVIILGGRSGTLSELAMAYDEGKVIGILEGTGGVADEARRLRTHFRKKQTGATLLYSHRPEELVEKALRSFHGGG